MINTYTRDETCVVIKFSRYTNTLKLCWEHFPETTFLWQPPPLWHWQRQACAIFLDQFNPSSLLRTFWNAEQHHPVCVWVSHCRCRARMQIAPDGQNICPTHFHRSSPRRAILRENVYSGCVYITRDQSQLGRKQDAKRFSLLVTETEPIPVLLSFK